VRKLILVLSVAVVMATMLALGAGTAMARSGCDVFHSACQDGSAYACGLEQRWCG
jgi:hypothetical protein